MKVNKLWHSRGYLPHFDNQEILQFVTFRLADSLPQNVLGKWRLELEKTEISDADFRKRIELYLDQNYGSCILKDNGIASIVQETLLKFDSAKYKLIAWVIMPNHVHLLIRVLEDNLLSSIMHSIKSYTAHEANKILGRKGRFWFKEYLTGLSATKNILSKQLITSKTIRSKQNFAKVHRIGNLAVHIINWKLKRLERAGAHAPPRARLREQSKKLSHQST